MLDRVKQNRAGTPRPTVRVAEAMYFDSGNHRLFGWLHQPSGVSGGRVGLVICNPFGYEAICSHRSVRGFAESAAEMGIPALRFDYAGAGDSADIDPHADQLDVWPQDILAAVQELQRRTGVERVCLLGLRLGALLASLAASQSKAVCGLILIAPIVSGTRYLRELRITRLVSTMGDAAASSTPSESQPLIEGSLEVSGFSFSPATLEALAKVDLAQRGAAPAPEMLVIDSSSLPVARGWVDALTQNGVRTEYHTMPGMVEMLMTDPQFAVVPTAAIGAMREWMTRLQGVPATPPASAEESAIKGDEMTPPVLQLPGDPAIPHSEVTERPVFLASEAVLFGIVTEPRPGDKRRRGVILLNVGAEHHIGSSRMYVSLARRWARRGYTVMRVDLAGLGDSDTRTGRPKDEVFPPAALDDIRTAVEFLRSQYNVGDITLGGLCSGAYHSLRAAIAAVPVNRILLVNPMNFLWQEGLTADDLQLDVDVARNVRFYRDRVLSAAIWKRILTGRLNVWRIVRIVMQRPLLDFESKLHDLARALGIRMPRDLGWELEEIGARGVKIVFVFASGEPGLDVLRLQAGSAIKRLGDRCLIHIIDSADHIFSHRATRDILERLLSDELFARHSRRGGSGLMQLGQTQ